MKRFAPAAKDLQVENLPENIRIGNSPESDYHASERGSLKRHKKSAHEGVKYTCN